MGGDGRFDSPGLSAQFGAYCVLEVNLDQVLDVELVQINEVKRSIHMGKEGFSRAFKKLHNHGLEVDPIITGRHVHIQIWIREKIAATHYFDVWHVAKGVEKKLELIARETKCEDVRKWIRSISNHLYWCAASAEPGKGDLSIAKWQPVANHIQNRHAHENSLLPSCLHDSLPQDNARYKWLKSGTKACVKLEEVVLSKKLSKDIQKLSHFHQTSNLEALKMLAFSYCEM